MRARIVLGVVAVLVLGMMGAASAESKRVGVPKFDGPQEAVVRKAVMQVLKRDGYELIGSRDLDAAARAAGTSLDSNDGFRAVAKELSISAFVTGEVAKKKAKLTVRNGSDGTVIGEGSFAGANPNKVAAEVRDGFARRLGSAVSRGRAPSGAKKPVAAPPPAADEDEEEAAPVAAKPVKSPPPAPKESAESTGESSTEASGEAAPDVVEKKAPAEAPGDGVAPRALDLFAAVRGFHRSLTFNQNLYPNQLSDYTLALGPAVVFDAIIFPGAFFTSGIGSFFGAAVNIEQAFGVGATRSSGETMPTIVHDYSGAFVFRLPFSGGNELLASIGGGEHAFSIRSGGGVSRSSLTQLPDTIYRYLRVGLGGRFMIASGLTLSASAGWRQILNKGGTNRYQIAFDGSPTDPTGFFPFLDVKAVDVTVGLGYQVTPAIELRANFDLRRYAFAMNSSPDQYPVGDFNGTMPVNKIAGGAVDQYSSFTVGVAYVFGGVIPGAAVVEDEPEAEAPPPEEKKPAKKKKAKKSSDDEDDEGDGDSDE